ncbi:MAG: P-loop NTPase [Candidatus Eisenbacteria sp.]|nr:P-loop NTPase [Candidatus Eisenbacteria bacterium]
MGECKGGGSGCSATGGGVPGMGAEQEAVDKRMSHIRHKIMVLSGKGGVGKSTVAVNLAYSLSLKGNRVGLLDVDVHGPSVPRMLGLDGQPVAGKDGGLAPVEMGPNLLVMSMGFLLRDKDDAVVWRGPLKANVIRQFLSDVEWGELDYLIIDSPPGTGDEPLSVGQLIRGADGAIVVTTPQEIALADVRKSISFCRGLGLPVLGVVENMSGLVCPHCGERVDVFKSGGGEEMARDMGVRFLGRIPLDPGVVELADRGKLVVEHALGPGTAESFQALAETVIGLEQGSTSTEQQPEKRRRDLTKGETRDPGVDGATSMRIAIPVAGGKLCAHFGHCETFALIDVDTEGKKIVRQERVVPPGHEPGVLPRWLSEQGANMIIAGGMGQRAQALFREQDIEVVVGASAEDPELVVQSYLKGNLETGDNLCDH